MEAESTGNSVVSPVLRLWLIMAHYKETQGCHLTGTNKNLYQHNWNSQNWLQLSFLLFRYFCFPSSRVLNNEEGAVVFKYLHSSITLKKKKALILYVQRHVKLSRITCIELSKSTVSCDWLTVSHRFHQQKWFPIPSENTVPVEHRQTQRLWITQYTKLLLHNSFCSARRDISVSIRFSKHFV